MIDTHFHLDLFEDYAALADEIERRGIYTLAVTNTPSFYRAFQPRLGSRRFIRLALGLHPELVADYAHELPDMLSMMAHIRYVGEVGLDGSSVYRSGLSLQRQVFGKILVRAAELNNRVLTVHSRRAEKDVIEMVGHEFPGKVILHWFSGSLLQAERALEAGLYFSLNPAMCRSSTGQKLAAALPRERVLTETDGPFVQFNGQPARPWNVTAVHQMMAAVWDMSEIEAQQQIRLNFAGLLQ